MLKSFSRDIMKKTRHFIFCISTLSLLICGCNNLFYVNSFSNSSESFSSNDSLTKHEPIPGQYQLTLIANDGIVNEKPHLLGEDSKTFFNAGDIVYFSIHNITDTEIRFKLNDDKMVEANPNNTNYLLHSFVMPEQDSVLKIKIFNGFFSDQNVPLMSSNSLYDWIYYLDEGDIVSASYTKIANGNITFSTFDECYFADENEVKDLYFYLTNSTVAFSDEQIPLGSETITINVKTKNNQTHSLTSYGDYLPGGALVTSLKLEEPFPTFSTFIGYSFNSFSLINIKVNNILNDDNVTNSFALENIEKMVFKKIEGVGFSASINAYNKYKFFNDMGFFIFQNQKTLSVFDDAAQTTSTYEIVNEYDFSSLYLTPEGQ